MGGPHDGVAHACPYCGRTLHWIPQRVSGRGTYECEQCGDFPDLTEPIDPAALAQHPSLRPLPLRLREHPEDRPRVLLVDDSAEYRDLYAFMLEETATVITASSGEEALAIAAAQPPDVIVLDVMMPGMDGWQTCERLKANRVTSGIPVVMLTSLDGLGVPETAARLGAAFVLIKPCPAERLAIAIKLAQK
jgi:CheY-like chemotaxis protein